MADYAIPKNGVAYIFYGCLVSQADTKLFKSGPTLAAGDFKVSIDGGAFANLATLPTNTPGTFSVKFSLSSGEMTGDNILVVASDAAGAEWCDQCWNIQTSARGIADLAYPATSGRSIVVDAAGLVDANTVKLGPSGSGTAQTARDIGTSVLLSTGTGTGQLDFTAGVVKANAVQLLGTAWLTPGVAGTPDVNAKQLGGTAQTGRDVGASVLLSTGTGTGQLDFTSGIVKSNVTQLLGTAWLTPGTAGTPDVNVKLWNGLTTVALPLIPTTAGRTLDVSATGEAGLDWANIGSPTTTVAFTGTTIATTQKVDIETIKTNPVVNAGTITFPTTATLASTTNITAGTITTVTNLTNAPTAGDLTAAMKTSVTTAADASLATTTYGEPAQGAPGATISLAAKINFLYKAWRNKSTQTATAYSLFADDTTTVDQKASTADDATTFTRGEIASGP